MVGQHQVAQSAPQPFERWLQRNSLFCDGLIISRQSHRRWSGVLPFFESNFHHGAALVGQGDLVILAHHPVGFYQLFLLELAEKRQNDAGAQLGAVGQSP